MQAQFWKAAIKWTVQEKRQQDSDRLGDSIEQARQDCCNKKWLQNPSPAAILSTISSTALQSNSL